MIIFRYPQILTSDLRTAAESTRRYLRQLVDQLNREMQELENRIDGNTAGKLQKDKEYGEIRQMVAASREIADSLRKKARTTFSIGGNSDMTISAERGRTAIIAAGSGGAWIAGADDDGKAFAITIAERQGVVVKAAETGDAISIENWLEAAVEFEKIMIS